MLLAVMLVFSPDRSCAAFAEMLPVPGEATLSVTVNVERDEFTPASYTDEAGEEVFLEPNAVLFDGSIIPVCSVSYVDRSNQDLGYMDSVTGMIDQQAGIRIQPVDGYYVSGLSLSSGDYTPSQKNLLSAPPPNWAPRRLRCTCLILRNSAPAAMPWTGIISLPGESEETSNST